MAEHLALLPPQLAPGRESPQGHLGHRLGLPSDDHHRVGDRLEVGKYFCAQSAELRLIDRPFKVYRSTTPCHHHHSLIILERRDSRIELQYLKKEKVVSKRSHTHGHLSRLRCTCRSHSRTCSGVHRRIRSPDALQHDSFDLLGCHLFRPLQIYEL